MRDTIKKYLPYFQFSAVVITIVIGVHTALERLLHKEGDPIQFKKDSFVIQAEKKDDLNHYKNVTFMYRRLREDCTLVSQSLFVDDEIGFRHDTSASKLKHIGDKDDEGYQKVEFFFLVPNGIRGTYAKFGGRIVYKCKEGDYVVELPDEGNSLFKIK